MGYKGAYGTQSLIATGSAFLEGSVPADFFSLVELTLWLIPDATDADWAGDLVCMYSANGQDYDVHIGAIDPLAMNLTINVVYNHDISAAFTSLAAGDAYGLQVNSDLGNETIELLGTRLKYRIRGPEQGGLAAIREQFYPCQMY